VNEQAEQHTLLLFLLLTLNRFYW